MRFSDLSQTWTRPVRMLKPARKLSLEGLEGGENGEREDSFSYLSPPHLPPPNSRHLARGYFVRFSYAYCVNDLVDILRLRTNVAFFHSRP